MIHSVFIPTDGPASAMAIVRELRSKGQVQGTDFEFRYNNTVHDQADGSILSRTGVTFLFKEAKWITLLKIQYGEANIHDPKPGTHWIPW